MRCSTVSSASFSLGMASTSPGAIRPTTRPRSTTGYAANPVGSTTRSRNSPSVACSAGPTPGCATIASGTRRPASSSCAMPNAISALAAVSTNQPIRAIHRPPGAAASSASASRLRSGRFRSALRPRRTSGRFGEIAAPRPQNRAQHASAVERKRRQHVEDGQHDVDRTEPCGDVGRCRAGPATRRAGRRRRSPARRAARRSRSETPPPPREHPLEARDAAEHPQCDSLDRHPLALGDDGVAELVQKERGKERHRRRPRHRGVGRRAPGPAQRPGTQRQRATRRSAPRRSARSS